LWTKYSLQKVRPQAALLLQSLSGFAQATLMSPAEDCWNSV
jgi:hypothetical protein